MAYYVYILKSVKDGSLYIGHTQDLEKRLKQHNSPTKKTYTTKRGPWERVHSEPFDTRAEAMTRERYLKSHAGAYEKKVLAKIG